MLRVCFEASGHKNIIGNHRTTLEITSEDFLTQSGTCIVGTCSNMTLLDLDKEIQMIARLPDTLIRLTLKVDEIIETIEGRGSEGLTYTDPVSMVIRKSEYECGRTLMVGADKSASDIRRDLIEKLKSPNTRLSCELSFVRQPLGQ